MWYNVLVKKKGARGDTTVGNDVMGMIWTAE